MAQKNGSKDLSKIAVVVLSLTVFYVVVVASLTAGYFVYQDYKEREGEVEFCRGMIDMMADAARGGNQVMDPEVYAQVVRTCAKYWYR